MTMMLGASANNPAENYFSDNELFLRVTADSKQGERSHMEDSFCVAYHSTLEEGYPMIYTYFGVFDGHGGPEAALYASKHLLEHIVSQDIFWSEEDEEVLKAIRNGFLSLHQAMRLEYADNWPRTHYGFPSNAGTTASVVFVLRGKLFIGHVGDSGIVLGYQDPQTSYWKAKPLTREHKPNDEEELERIIESGGKVEWRNGTPRVVWRRPQLGYQGDHQSASSTPVDEVPFLAVARSLGDFWSYNPEHDEFAVSPEPDVSVHEIDLDTYRCLIIGSDGLWNVLSPHDAVYDVQFAHLSNTNQLPGSSRGSSDDVEWINPSRRLVQGALKRWDLKGLRADNTTAVTVVIDPLGPPGLQDVLPPIPDVCAISSNQDPSEKFPPGNCDSQPVTQSPLKRTPMKNKRRGRPPKRISHSPIMATQPKVNPLTRHKARGKLPKRILPKKKPTKRSSQSPVNKAKVSWKPTKPVRGRGRPPKRKGWRAMTKSTSEMSARTFRYIRRHLSPVDESSRTKSTNSELPSGPPETPSSSQSQLVQPEPMSDPHVQIHEISSSEEEHIVEDTATDNTEAGNIAISPSPSKSEASNGNSDEVTKKGRRVSTAFREAAAQVLSERMSEQGHTEESEEEPFDHEDISEVRSEPQSPSLLEGMSLPLTGVDEEDQMECQEDQVECQDDQIESQDDKK